MMIKFQYINDITEFKWHILIFNLFNNKAEIKKSKQYLLIFDLMPFSSLLHLVKIYNVICTTGLVDPFVSFS